MEVVIIVIAIVITGLLTMAVMYEPADSNDVNYEVASTEVYRRLDRMVSCFDSNERLDDTKRKLKGLKIKSLDIKSRNTRKAYAQWVPYFIKQCDTWIRYNNERDNHQKYKKDVEHP